MFNESSLTNGPGAESEFMQDNSVSLNQMNISINNAANNNLNNAFANGKHLNFYSIGDQQMILMSENQQALETPLINGLYYPPINEKIDVRKKSRIWPLKSKLDLISN